MESRTDHETDRRWILVVDGDVQTQRILDLSLRSAGFEVKATADATEALTWLSERRPDLIVADTQLTGAVDGFELCRRVKQHAGGPAVPFVFLAEPTVESKMRGVEVGADDFLTKPVYVQEVVARARALLQRRERQRLEELARGNERFVGELADIPLVDLVRAVEANQKSGVVHLVGPDGARGEIYFRQGAVVDAEVGRLSARDAVYRLFSWPSGRFDIEWKSIRRKDAVAMEPPALLMEALRRVEEWRRLLAEVPPLDTVFEVDYRLLAERLAEIPDEVNGILRLFDGVRTFIQVIDDCGLPDLDALAVIGKLYRERIIRDVKAKSESDEAAAADADGWLNDAAGPFRTGGERARRELFGPSQPGASGVHGRPTAPVEPLEEAGGREALVDDLRARFTDRLNTPDEQTPVRRDGAQVTTAPGVAPAGAPADSPPPGGAAEPLPAPFDLGSLPPSETTLQGVGLPAVAPRPTTSPGFAAATTSSPGGLPEVTPQMRPPPDPAGGAGDGIPEPVTPAEAEPAIVIPFPAAAAAGRTPGEPGPDMPVGGDEPRVVAGEIVARTPTPWRRESRASEQRLAQFRETGAKTITPPERATDPGIGPSPHSLPPVRPAEGEVVIPLVRRSSTAHAAARSGDDDESGPLSAREAAAELGVRSRARGTLLVLLAVGVVGGGAWALARRRGDAPVSPEEAHAQVTSPSPASSGAGTTATSAAGPGAPGSTANTVAGMAGAGGGAGGPAITAAASPAAADELDERAADPKVARSLPDEFPQLLGACRTAFTEKRMKDAEAACTAAKDANPQSADAYAMLAHALFNRHHRREALGWAERAVKIDAKLADAYVIIGGVRQDAGDMAAAKAAYKRYLDLAPTGQYAADLRAIVDSQ